MMMETIGTTARVIMKARPAIRSTGATRSSARRVSGRLDELWTVSTSDIRTDDEWH